MIRSGKSLDKESQALQAEYGRILTTAKFNGTNVFTTGDMATQAGFGAEAVILVNISSGSSTTITITTTGTDTITTTTTTTTTTTKGDGTFQAKQSFGTGNGPCSVAVGDFNGDGKSDLVTADQRQQHRERAARQRQRNVSGQAVPSAPEAGLLSCCGRLQRRRQERPGYRGLQQRHRERAARQRQRDVSGQAVLRHRNRAWLSCCGRLQRRRQE